MVAVAEIPDKDDLYYRVHVSLTDRGKLRPNCFRDPGGGISVDWSKYRTPQETRAAKGTENAGKYGVATLPVGRVREIKDLRVEHAPPEDNDAHSHILGLSSQEDELRTEQRAELYNACDRRWTIRRIQCFRVAQLRRQEANPTRCPLFCLCR